MLKRGIAVFTLFAVIMILALPLGRPCEVKANEGLTSEPLSIILLIDISGSMSRTDPQRLRETASGVFIDMLSPEDNLGIFIFDHEVEIVVPLAQVEGYDNKRRIKEILFPRLDPRGFTDYLGALEAVFAHLQEANTDGTKPVVIFLTDGDPNPHSGARDDPDFMAGYMEELWGSIRQYTLERYPIYTVGFGQELQPGVLEKIAQETLGGYHMLTSADELLVTFFKLLSQLKNRQMIMEETLPAGVEETFPFFIDEYTQQVNLVAAAERGGAVTWSLTSPDGQRVEPGRLEGFSLAEEEGSTLIVLHELAGEYFGEWELSVSGTSGVTVLGDKDLYIKAWLEEPVPSSQQPVNEPLNFRVLVNREGELKDLPLQVEAELSGSGLDRPALIPLQEETPGIFVGTYEDLTRAGIYDIEIRLWRDDELLTLLSASIHAQLLPSITTDFFIDETYRLGEEFIVTASLMVGGNRIPEGRDLKVDEFQIILEYRDGTRENIPFLDSGDYDEHGDLRAGDGIWSNRFSLEREGTADASLLAVGEYRGTEFVLQKKLGTFSVYPPGQVYLDVQGDFWGVSGRDLSIPLHIRSESGLPETLYIETDGDAGTLTQQQVDLQPGEEKTVDLRVSLDSGLEAGIYSISLTFTAGKETTLLAPQSIEVPVEILTASAAFARRYLPMVTTLLAIVAALIIIILLIIIFGLILYKTRVSPLARVGGSLFYRKSGGTKDDPWQELKFKKKKEIVITFDPDNKSADFYIEGSEFQYDLEIMSLWPKRGPRFLQGLQSFRNEDIQAKTIIRCTPPGIIEFAGKIYTEKELLHDDHFESAEFTFHYVNAYAKWYKGKEEGVDLLEGRAFLGDHEDSPGL